MVNDSKIINHFQNKTALKLFYFDVSYLLLKRYDLSKLLFVLNHEFDFMNTKHVVIPSNDLKSRWTWISIVDESKRRLKELDNDEILTSLMLLKLWFIGCVALCNYQHQSRRWIIQEGT